MHTASRYHDICAGHRVYGHESKCAHFHGHNYRIHFHCKAAGLDSVGRVIDFSEIKARLCMWLENEWDHKFLLWSQDPCLEGMRADDPDGVVEVPFNPTAENMAEFLVEVVGPAVLPQEIELYKVVIEETAKCSATYEKPQPVRPLEC